MVKKALIVGVGILVVGGIAMSRKASSYVRTSLSCVQDQAQQLVPVSFELERARSMIEDLKPEIANNMHRIAREEVEVEKLEHQLSELESRQASTQQAVLRLKNDLQSGQQVFVYAKKTLNAGELRTALAVKFERCKTLDDTVNNLRKNVDFRRQGLESGRQKLEALLTARDQLQLEVEGLEARRKMIEVQQTASDLHIDDSQLARTRELVTDIQTRLDVTERLMATTGEFSSTAEITFDEPEDTDLLEQIATYFGEPSATSVAPATSVAQSEIVPPASSAEPLAEVERLAEVAAP